MAVESVFIGNINRSTGTVLNIENDSPQVTSETPQRANAPANNLSQAKNKVNGRTTGGEYPRIYAEYLQKRGQSPTEGMPYAEHLLKQAEKKGNIYAKALIKAEIEKAQRSSRKADIDPSTPMPTIYADYMREHSMLEDYETSDVLNVDLENDANSDTIKMDRKQPTHRKLGESGRKIIDKATYHKVTAQAIRKGADIRIANDELMHYLKTRNATAVTIGDIIIFRPDATTSEVLEEIHHFYQNCAGLNNRYGEDQRRVMNELDTLEYLLSVSDKYKIPAGEIEETKRLREFYRNEKERLKREGEWID